MRAFTIVAGIACALLAACQAQSQTTRGQPGWRMGAYDGPMMYAGYCPGGRDGSGRRELGWYGPGMRQGGALGARMMGAGMMGGGMMGGARGPGPTGAGRMAPFTDEQAQNWLADAKQQIAITPAQEAKWLAYVEAVRADRGAMTAMHGQMLSLGQAGMDAPDRLQAHADLMAQRAASLERLQTATRALYDVLTSAQRTRADKDLWSGCW